MPTPRTHAIVSKCITRELRQAFPRKKFNVRVGLRGPHTLDIKWWDKTLDVKKIKRIANRWYRAAYGVSIRWGKAYETKD